MVSFFTAGRWKKGTIFGAAQTNIWPFLFCQSFNKKFVFLFQRLELRKISWRKLVKTSDGFIYLVLYQSNLARQIKQQPILKLQTWILSWLINKKKFYKFWSVEKYVKIRNWLLDPVYKNAVCFFQWSLHLCADHVILTNLVSNFECLFWFFFSSADIKIRSERSPIYSKWRILS